MYQKADPASIKKNTAQMRHSCTISSLRPPGEPSPTSERGKTKKIRRKRATVAPYFTVANQPGNRPQLALPGAFCYTLVYSRINLFLLFRALPILPRQEKESNQWRPGGKEL